MILCRQTPVRRSRLRRSPSTRRIPRSMPQRSRATMPSLPIGPVRSTPTRWCATTPIVTTRVVATPIGAAYPLHPVYREGGYGRTSPDPRSPDPVLYPTNIAPQPNDAASTFGEVWGCIECPDRVAGDCRSGLPDRAADRSDPLPRRAGLRQGAAQSLRPGILTGAGAVSRECEPGL